MNTEYYIIVRKGHVSRLPATNAVGEMVKVWPVAENHKDAKRLAKHLSRNGMRLTSDRIGTIPGETLEGHVQLALDDGCVAVCCVHDWSPDGEPIWKWIHFDSSIAASL